MKFSILSILAILMCTQSFAQDCKPSLYQYENKNLCFSTKLKSYLTQDCADDKCGALEFVTLSKTINTSKVKAVKDAPAGLITCGMIGGKSVIISSEKTPDKVCLCVAKDNSALSCSSLGLR